MKTCKKCKRRLVYAKIQSEGRVSTYECVPCKRRIDIPWAPEGSQLNYEKRNLEIQKRNRHLAKWYLEKIGNYKTALQLLQELDPNAVEPDEEEEDE